MSDNEDTTAAVQAKRRMSDSSSSSGGADDADTSSSSMAAAKKPQDELDNSGFRVDGEPLNKPRKVSAASPQKHTQHSFSLLILDKACDIAKPDNFPSTTFSLAFKSHN